MAGDLVEVELDDDEAAAPHAAVGARPARTAPRSARGWARAAAGLALVLAAGAGLDGAFAASLVHVPDGLVADLRVPRAQRWSVPAGDLLGVAGDTLVVTSPDRQAVRALDLADGRTRWSLDATGCELADARGEVVASRAPTVPAGRARLLCRFMETTQTTTMLVADAADGTVLTRLTDGPGDSWISAAGPVAITTATLPYGRVNIAAYSLETGEHLWTAPTGAPLDGGWYVQGRTWVLLSDPPTARDVRTGEEVPVPATAEWASSPLPDGSVVRATASARGDATGAQTIVVGPDGHERWRAPGSLTVQPGRGAVVVPVQAASGRLEVRDLRDGTVLWETGRSLLPLDVVGDVLVALDWQSQVAGSTFLVGLDARTGADLWRSAGAPSGLLVDGTRFAVDVPGGVEVRDLRTGAPLARWPVALDDAPASGDGTTDAATGALVAVPGGAVAWVGADRAVLLGL